MRHPHDVHCQATYATFGGAVYLREFALYSMSSPDLIAVMPGRGTSYQRRFPMPYAIERMSLVDNRLVFISDEGVGVMTPACAPP